jgi:hypothetical protein
MDVSDSYGVYIVTEGCGEILGEGYRKEIRKGDYFFMPCSMMGKFSLVGNMQVVECY